MSLKAKELIVLSYISTYGRVDLYEIQKVINAPILQIADIVDVLYQKKMICPNEDGEGFEVTDVGETEPTFKWKEWTWESKQEKEKPEYGEINEWNDKKVPVLRDYKHVIDMLDLHNIDENAYHSFSLYKGEKERKILAPSLNLKERQRWILENILEKIPVEDCVHGFVKGKSIKTNAECHVGKKEIMCLDIENFFPSIGSDRVAAVFKNVGYSQEVVEVLTRICIFEGELPQGAPTSPYLSNIVFSNIDKLLLDYAQKNNLIYTRYADDLTFSTDDADIEKHFEAIEKIILENNFVLNESKIHIMKDKYRKIVTGLLVNDRVRIPASYKRKLRQEIYYCNKYGIDQHLRAIGRECAVNFKDYLYGKAYFINMVEREEGEKFLEKIDELFDLKNC